MFQYQIVSIVTIVWLILANYYLTLYVFYQLYWFMLTNTSHWSANFLCFSYLVCHQNVIFSHSFPLLIIIIITISVLSHLYLVIAWLVLLYDCRKTISFTCLCLYVCKSVRKDSLNGTLNKQKCKIKQQNASSYNTPYTRTKWFLVYLFVWSADKCLSFFFFFCTAADPSHQGPWRRWKGCWYS